MIPICTESGGADGTEIKINSRSKKINFLKYMLSFHISITFFQN